MADPLAELAEREVPAPTNYFNPADAQTIISRYANNRKSLDVAERVSKFEDGERNARGEEARLARQKIEWDRDDEDYFTRKDALAQQGEFMERLYSIKGDDPEYDTKITEFLGASPPELLEQPNVKAALAYKGKVNGDYRQRVDAEASKKQSLDNQIAVIRERAKNTAALKGITDDDIQQATMPDGTIDMLTLGMKAGQRDRGYKEGEFDRRLDKTTDARIEVGDAAQARKTTPVDPSVFANKKAFPSRVDDVKADYKRVTGKEPVDTVLEVSKDWKDKYATAQDQDKNREKFELDTAFEYDDPEEYVNLVPGLNDREKARRRSVWEDRHGKTPQKESSKPAETKSATPEGASKPKTPEDWLKLNPDDPRAPEIRKRLGIK